MRSLLERVVDDLRALSREEQDRAAAVLLAFLGGLQDAVFDFVEAERAGRYSGTYRIGECWAIAPAWVGAAGALQTDIGSALSVSNILIARTSVHQERALSRHLGAYVSPVGPPA